MLKVKNIYWFNPSRHILTQAKVASEQKFSEWRSVVGLEIHAQIASESKLFSGSSASFDAAPNTAVSYFDASLPGTLPVLNRKCVKHGIKTALALGCRVNEVSMFDRKHYFYADLPAGYQITQQRAALAHNGSLRFPVVVPGKKIYYKTVRLLQLQLEQDSGRSLHDDIAQRSLVDLNRAGFPLMELVFAPDLETGEEAASLVKELTLILRRLQTCNCKMEEGALRVDANISVHREGDELSVRTEVKNIGSIRSIAQAVSFEINRQLDLVADGGVVMNETRSWDADLRRTVPMRDKEVLQDYRFMPETNLPPLRLNLKAAEPAKSESDLLSVPSIALEIPELPDHTRQYLIEQCNLTEETAVVLVNQPVLLTHFFEIIKCLHAIPKKLVTNFLINELLSYCNKNNIDPQECSLTSNNLKDILKSLHAEEINLKSAKALIELMHDNPKSDINALIKEHDLSQISSTAQIEELCRAAIENQPKAVQSYRNGKAKAFLAVVGEAARLSKQKANMKLVAETLKKMLSSET